MSDVPSVSTGPVASGGPAAIGGAAIGGPVAIGGLGGSGTRVVAEALRAAGFRIGTRLNRPLDNLWFTVLFKRRAWTERIPTFAETFAAARLFERAMTVGLATTMGPEERALLEALATDLAPTGTWRPGAAAADAQDLARSGPAQTSPAQTSPAQTSPASTSPASTGPASTGPASTGPASTGPWGWKEPNTHLFLPALDRAIPGLRYVHLVRDGLDMAFSDNTWQARHWSHLYGLTARDDDPLPVRQLRYWLAANLAAAEYGAGVMGRRFLLVSYEALCADPTRQFGRLAAFLDGPTPAHRGEVTGSSAALSPTTINPAMINPTMINPTTIGRARDRDRSIFSRGDLEALDAVRARLAEIEALRPVADAG